MKKIILLTLLPIFLTYQSDAKVIHWLSQVQGEAGSVANHSSFFSKISTNGRYVAFGSSATNLIENDTNENSDVFMKDLITGETTLVTTLSNNSQFADSVSYFSKPTSDGRYVAFISDGDELPSAQGFAKDHIYVKDLQTAVLTNHSEYGSGLFFDALNTFHMTDDAQFLTFNTYNQIDGLHGGSFEYQVYRKSLFTGMYELISISFDGNEVANDDTYLVDVSHNGRFILMRSEATNLTTAVINNGDDNLFLHDVLNDTTTLINTTPSGESSAENNSASSGAVSNIGTVVFNSTQSDLVAGDNNDAGDVFYYDNGVLTLITLDENGNQIPDGFTSEMDISGDGSRIVFSQSSSALVNNDENDRTDLYAYITATGELSLITINDLNTSANGYSSYPDLSLDGNRMVFLSQASDLNQQPVIPDGQEIFIHQFSSQAFNKISNPLFNPNTIIDGIGTAFSSSDQMTVIYSATSPNITNDLVDPEYSHMYLLDRNTNQNHLLLEKAGVNHISPSGRYVVFTSNFFHPGATIDLGIGNVYLLDRLNDDISLIDEGVFGRVNNDGLVVFQSRKSIAPNDVNDTYDIYLFDPNSQQISLVSETMGGEAAIGTNPTIGGTGNNTYVTFTSDSDQLTVADSNGFTDIFMKKIPSGPMIRISQTASGLEGDADSEIASISADGNHVVFTSRATNLTSDDYSQAGDTQVFYYDRLSTEVKLASLNEAGLPLYSQNASIYYTDISSSGRYISYRFSESNFDGIDFIGDEDNRDDLVLFDTQTETARIITLDSNDQHIDAAVGYRMQVLEDLSQSPPLVGVLFTARNTPEWTGVANHPGHEEVFLYQQGGDDLTLQVTVNGFGQIAGTSGINCSAICAYDFSLGTDISLIATPDPNMVFDRWEVDFGHCNDAVNPCELLMDREKSITAYFMDPNDVIFNNGFE